MQNFIGIESGLALYYIIDLLMIIAAMEIGRAHV